MDDLTRRQDRSALLRAAIILSAAVNSNSPQHAKRILATKFGIDARAIELEITCQELAADALRSLSKLAPERAA